MLGWRILKQGEYKVDMPLLSIEEEEIICEMSNRFKEIIRISELKTEAEAMQTLQNILDEIGRESKVSFDKEQKRYLADTALKHIYGLIFFDELLKDQDIEEIAVIGINEPIYIFMPKKGWKTVNAEITEENELIEIINKMAKGLGRRITLQHPRLDTSLPDGSRLHASISPISKGEMTIRKFKSSPLSPRHLIGFRTGNAETMAIMSMLMQSDSSVIIAGNTAGGKTTTLNSLFSFVPKNERILITEETPEISIPHKHQIRMVANKDMGISLMDLIYDSLRMRPDRIIVGEVRNREETNALVDVLLGGQARGIYATFHAQSSQEALNRLLSMGIEQINLSSIDAILVQRRMLIYDKRKRTNTEVRKISELSIIENGSNIPIVRYDISNDNWKISNLEKAIEALESKLGISNKEIKQELDERKERIEKAPMEFGAFYNSMQEWLYSE
ncbi:MAG: ATPase, T2SS/T4P/T4SS family [Candidatus Micrarchaeota archaeon]|nr:ATPase, T2SS/T4P/T4SS family [Candidatus Micrarchaeota archaeon]